MFVLLDKHLTFRFNLIIYVSHGSSKIIIFFPIYFKVPGVVTFELVVYECDGGVLVVIFYLP